MANLSRNLLRSNTISISTNYALIRLQKLSLFIVVMLSCVLANAQQLDDPVARRERGITLYQQGKDKDAVEVLQAFVKRYTTDAQAWHYLGLAYSRLGETEEARKAHEAAAKSAVELTKEYLAHAKPDILCEMVRPLWTVLKEAAESAERYLQLSEKPSTSKVEEWRTRAEELRRYLKVCPQSRETGDKADAKVVATKPIIISKPAPEYTHDARIHGTKGTVVLFMIFAEDGIVKGIVPLVSLPNGLTGMAIKAARKIKFTPATENGKSVSRVIQVEYNFHIY